MKATINGITIEGTFEEILSLQQKMQAQPQNTNTPIQNLPANTPTNTKKKWQKYYTPQQLKEGIHNTMIDITLVGEQKRIALQNKFPELTPQYLRRRINEFGYSLQGLNFPAIIENRNKKKSFQPQTQPTAIAQTTSALIPIKSHISRRWTDTERNIITQTCNNPTLSAKDKIRMLLQSFPERSFDSILGFLHSNGISCKGMSKGSYVNGSKARSRERMLGQNNTANIPNNTTPKIIVQEEKLRYNHTATQLRSVMDRVMQDQSLTQKQRMESIRKEFPNASVNYLRRVLNNLGYSVKGMLENKTEQKRKISIEEKKKKKLVWYEKHGLSGKELYNKAEEFISQGKNFSDGFRMAYEHFRSVGRLPPKRQLNTPTPVLNVPLPLQALTQPSPPLNSQEPEVEVSLQKVATFPSIPMVDNTVSLIELLKRTITQHTPLTLKDVQMTLRLSINTPYAYWGDKAFDKLLDELFVRSAEISQYFGVDNKFKILTSGEHKSLTYE